MRYSIKTKAQIIHVHVLQDSPQEIEPKLIKNYVMKSYIFSLISIFEALIKLSALNILLLLA